MSSSLNDSPCEQPLEEGLLLVVDDNEMNRDILSRRLSRRGYTVATAENGREALEKISSESFDVVILDIMMPDIDGIEVLRRVRETTTAADLPIIMLTAKSESEDVVQALMLGANDYVTKPLDFPVVHARVQTQVSLKRMREELRLAHARMKHDLEIAAQVQRALLPTDLPSFPGAAACAWRYIACDELAGDAVNIFGVEDRYLCFYVLDVSGHGVPASLVSVSVTRNLTIYADRSSLVRTESADGSGSAISGPAEVARRLNRIYPMDTSDANLYFTLVYGVLDTQTNRLRFVCAGHPGPVLVRVNGVAEVMNLSALPIGILADAEFEEKELDLHPGDRVYLYSDGVIEQPNASGEMFGQDRLQALIAGQRSVSLQASLDALVGSLVAWRGSGRFEDDISVVAIEIPPG
ncbi:MAG: SpoIIE family protein phosphatase [Chitinivibrionia bacterium]|nr:SpoIIE family protein phosphatase [Chitinivibrionia bacterium]